MQCNAMQYNAMQCNAMQREGMRTQMAKWWMRMRSGLFVGPGTDNAKTYHVRKSLLEN